MTVRSPDDIVKEISELEIFITKNIGVNCGFGDKDITPEQYPYIKILPDLTITPYEHSFKAYTLQLPLTLKIIASRDNELEVLEVFQKIVKKINQFNDYRGHEIVAPIEPEYLDNTFELSVPFNLKLIIQET
jgi:hypothetical protein